MRTSTFITLAIASLMINVTHAKKSDFVKRQAGGGNIVTNTLSSVSGSGGPLALAGGLAGGVTSGGSGTTQSEARKKKRSATGGLPIVGTVLGGGASGVGSGSSVAGVDLASVLGGGSQSTAAAGRKRKRGLPVVGAVLGGGGSKKSVAGSNVQGGGKSSGGGLPLVGGLPIVGGLLGGGGSNSESAPTTTRPRRGNVGRPGGKGKGKGKGRGRGRRGRRGHKVKPYSDITANQVQAASAARAAEGDVGSGFPHVGGLLGKRAVYKDKRGTGYPETRETMGKTVLVLDDTAAKTANAATQAAAGL